MISIIIITYGRKEELFETLKCINQYQGEDIELLLLDNNPSNALEAAVKELISNSNIRFIYFQDGVNYGVAEGRNYLIEKSRGDILITLDDDIEIDNITQLVNKVESYFSENRNVGALAFNIKNFYSRESLRHEIPHGNKNLDFSKNMLTYYYIGAGHAIRKDVYNQVGLYPNDLGKYGGEERDLSFRILEAGYDILYVSDIVIYHKVSPYGRMKKEEENFYRYRNQLVVLNRYMPFKYRITSNIFWSLFYLLRMKGSLFKIVTVLNEVKKITRNTISEKTLLRMKKLRSRVYY
ncbi:glycosyltransferase family 2 protein [Pasteurellaceae bacterium 22721_9_1]